MSYFVLNKFACTIAENATTSSPRTSRSSADTLCMTESMSDAVLDSILNDGVQQGNNFVK